MAEQLATQVNNNPTNKLSAGTTVAGVITAVAVAVSPLLGDALKELLPSMGPATQSVLIAAIGAIVGVIAKYGGQFAAYNVHDEVNKPL